MTSLNPDSNLPPNANPEQYRKQAKDLLQNFRTQKPAAIRRFGIYHPRYQNLLTRDLLNVEVKLADAQLVIAHELGFNRWAELSDAIKRQSPSSFIVPEDLVERQATYHREGVRGNVEFVERLLASDPSLLDCLNEKGRTLIEALPGAQGACEGLKPPLVGVYRLLKNAGAQPSMVAAVRANDVEMVSALLATKPWPELRAPTDKDIPVTRAWGSNFVMAADNGHLEIVDLLLAVAHISEDEICGAMGRALLYCHFPVAELLLQTGTSFEFDCLGTAEFQEPSGLRWELEHGADPNVNDGQALKMVLSTYGRKTGPKHECIELLIEHGADWTDDPVMAIHRGQVDRLAEFLDVDPDLIHTRVSLDYGVHLSLFDVTLLHVAVEFNERDCVELLLKRGADLNAPAGFEQAGIGGQTPIYHAIGGNQGLLLPLFKYLMTRGPDLHVTAQIQYEPLYDAPGEVEELTPLGYAKRYADGPAWRQSNREAAIIQAAIE